MDHGGTHYYTDNMYVLEKTVQDVGSGPQLEYLLR